MSKAGIFDLLTDAVMNNSIKRSASLIKKQEAARDKLVATIKSLKDKEKDRWPSSITPESMITMDEGTGLIEYPDELIDMLGRAGKGDVGKMVANVNAEAFDTVKGPDGVGLGTVYREAFDKKQALHGTRAATNFRGFKAEGYRPLYNDTPDSRISDSFSGWKSKEAGEKFLTKDEVRENADLLLNNPNALKELHDYEVAGNRVIPVDILEENRWDFRNARHVDEIVDNIPAADVGYGHPLADDINSGVLDANDVIRVEVEGSMEEMTRGELKKDIKDGQWDKIEIPEVGQSAQSLGYDTGSVMEMSYSQQGAGGAQEFGEINRVNYHPERARLPWAFKDPAKYQSANMMGSADRNLVNKIAGTAVGGAVAAPLLFGSEDAESMELLPKAVKGLKNEASREVQRAKNVLGVETPSELTRARNKEGIHAEQGNTVAPPSLAGAPLSSGGQMAGPSRLRGQRTQASTDEGEQPKDWGAILKQQQDWRDKRARRGQTSSGQARRGERLRDKRAQDTLRELGGEEALAQYASLTGDAKRVAQADALEYYNEMNPSMLARAREQFTGTRRMDAQTPEDRVLIENTPEFHLGRTGFGTAYDPENRATAANEFALQTGLATTWDDQGRKNVIANQIPGAKFRSVGEGDYKVDFVTLPNGKEFVINKPGFSETDGTLLAAELAAYYPMLKFVGKGVGLANKMIRGAGSGAATDTAIQGAGMLAGNEKDYSPEQSAIVASTGVLGETLRPGYHAAKRFLGKGPENNIPSVRGLGSAKKQWDGLGDLEFPLE